MGDKIKSTLDWLGQEYEEGDTIIYGAGSGRSITMVMAVVTELRDNGNVSVRPLKSSRWKQHDARRYYVDTRTGRRIDPHAPSGKHVKVHGHYAEKSTGLALESKRYGYGGMWGYFTEDGRLIDMDHRKFVSTEFQPWVEVHTEDEPRPVTLSVTDNITKWPGARLPS